MNVLNLILWLLLAVFIVLFSVSIVLAIFVNPVWNIIAGLEVSMIFLTGLFIFDDRTKE